MTATKASTCGMIIYSSKASGLIYRPNLPKNSHISYRRGLTGVAYPFGKAMREPESWDKQKPIPTLFLYARGAKKTRCRQGESRDNKPKKKTRA